MSARVSKAAGRRIGAFAAALAALPCCAVAGAGAIPVQYAPSPGPPPPGPVSPGFWVVEDGRQVGLVHEAQLRARAAGGMLSADTPVWAPGIPSWLPAAGVPALGGLLPPRLPRGVPPSLVPPPAASAPAVSLDPSRYMLGAWDLQTDFDVAQAGKLRLTLVARYEGAGRGMAQGTVQRGESAFPVQIVGSWHAIPLAADRFAFTGTMAIADRSGPPQSRSITDSTVVQVVDRETLHTQSGFMRRRQP